MLKKIRPPVSAAHVDEYGVPKKAKKAWDGQNKDRFFRDKYAHVHARQLKEPKVAFGVSPKKAPTSASTSAPRSQPRPDFATKFRLDPRHELLFGTSAVQAALDRRQVVKLWSGQAQLPREILAKCAQKLPIEVATPMQHLNIMANGGVHNKIIAEVVKREYPEFVPQVENNILKVGTQQISCAKAPLGVFIDEVTDTHNFGAILRCAYYLGADFAVFSTRNCAPMSAQVIKSSAGAAEYLPIFTATSPLRLFDSLHGWNRLATLAKQKNPELVELIPQELGQLRTAPTLLVVGSEDRGIRTSIAQRCTHSTAIPSAQKHIDSLNVSVATALLLQNLCT